MDREAILPLLFSLVMVAIVVGAPVSCTVHSNNLKAQAIRDGSDPIAADCAFSTLNDSSVACALAAARLQQTQSGKEQK